MFMAINLGGRTCIQAFFSTADIKYTSLISVDDQ